MLPEHIINKIMLYVSHPVADIYRCYGTQHEDFGKEKIVLPSQDDSPACNS
jgi:hypothetical protein